MPDRNRMSVAEVQALDKQLTKSRRQGWREWEQEIEGMFKANKHRWLWFHLPRLKTKKDNQRLPKNLPDYWGIGKVGSDREGWLLVVEAKTGGGVQTEGQAFFMRCILAVSGVRGGTYYPHDRGELKRLIGPA